MNLLPSLSEAEYTRLKESIKTHGYMPEYPVVYDQDGNVLDGHHRLRACEELGVEPTKVTVHVDGEWERMVRSIEPNVARRHLTPDDRIRMILLLERAQEPSGTSTAPPPKGEKAHHDTARRAAGTALDGQFNPPANDATIARHRANDEARSKAASVVSLGESQRRRDRARTERLEAAAEKLGKDDVLDDFALGRVSLRQAEVALGLIAPPPAALTYEAPADDEAARAEIVQFINVTRSLATGFNEEKAKLMRELADDLLIPLRKIERYYCEARKK